VASGDAVHLARNVRQGKIMKNTCYAVVIATIAAFTTVINTASAGMIIEEGFESDGLDIRYTAGGAGGSLLGCCQNWSLHSQDEGERTDALTGFDGQDFWSGSDLNDRRLPSGYTYDIPRNLILNTVAVSLLENLSLTVSLAASTNLDVGRDFIRIFALDTDTNIKTQLDYFDGDAAGITSGVTLGNEFQELSYDLSWLDVASLQIGFEVWTTTNSEVVGIDNIRLSGTQTSLPSSISEPNSGLLLGFAMIALLGASRSKCT